MSSEEVTLARLHELLELKDAEAHKLQCEIEELRRQLHYEVDWMLHEKMEGDSRLPSPRLELQAMQLWEQHSEWRVALVLAERSGQLTQVPLEYSKRSGGAEVVPSNYPTTGELPVGLVRNLSSLVNDLCWQHESMGLPAYVRLDNAHIYHVTQARPELRMIAVPAQHD